MKEIELNVKGIECAGCENRIKNALLLIKEVKEVSASHETGKVNVILKKDVTDEIREKIITSICNIGFEVEK